MKKIKYIVEMIFIFLLPMIILGLCFKTTKIYDENGNETSKYYEFNNIFVLNNETQTFYNYSYYDYNEVINFNQNDIIIYNSNISPFIHYNSGEYDFMYYLDENNNTHYIYFNNYIYITSGIGSNTRIIENNDNGVTIIRLNNNETIINKHNNIIKNINTYTLNKNAINNAITIIYNQLGITDNWVLQLIVIYTLLLLTMSIIWHIIFRPIDYLMHLIDHKERF